MKPLPAPWRIHALGVEAVKKYDAIIIREAKRKGVDPDLVRAIIYMENADGNPLNLNRLVEEFGMASSIPPRTSNRAYGQAWTA